MSHPELRLVWVNLRPEARLAKGKEKKQQETTTDKLPDETERKVDWSPWIPPTTIVGTGLGVIVLMLTLFLVLFNKISGVETSLANLTGRLEPIFNQYYQPFKKAAEERGFSNPGLLPINLVYADTPIDHPPRLEAKGNANNLDYDITYELIKLTGSTMTFRVNGRVGTVNLK